MVESRDKNMERGAATNPQYVRQQKGHSIILWMFLGAPVLWIPCIYWTISPNHYWHA